jgi:hypothetical protein
MPGGNGAVVRPIAASLHRAWVEGGLDGSVPDLVNVAQRHGCIPVVADQRNLLAR